MKPARNHPLLPVLAVLLVAATALPALAAKAKPDAAAPGTRAADAPFWTGTPDAATFTKINQDRLDKAKAAIARMIAVKGKRTIENTLVPYDEAGLWLDTAAAQASLIENTHPDDALRAAGEQMGQKVAAYATEISLNRDVYDALSALDLSGADEETRFFVQRDLRDFRLAGVDKDEATRKRIKAVSDTLVKIGQEFQRNIREDVRSIQVKPEDLAGLPQDFIDAHKPGENGLVKLDTTNPDYGPVMAYVKSDDVRKRLYMERENRAYPKNMDVLKRLMQFRHEMANLVGYTNWADFVTANKMVGSGKNVREFIDKIVQASGASAERDYKTLLARKQKDVPGATAVDLWESSYYSELVRRSEYDFDSQSIRPYLPYDQVKQGALGLYSKLFGVTFKPADAPVWHPSVDAYEMYDGDVMIGRFYLDMHPRANKYGHAAQFDIRAGIAGRQLPEAALICNFPGGKEGDPGLCEIGDVRTFFHEFGHLLHTLFAGHRAWFGTAGIKTERDFVEAPSQMLEEWMQDPATLQTFARHHETGEALPTELVHRMKRAGDFAKGLGVRRQMTLADLSLSIYNRDPAQVDIDAMTQDLIGRYQPFKYVDGTHFACAFTHLDGYSAVYYTYMWSLVIAKDMFSAFDRTNLMDPVVATRYRKTVLAAGGSAPAAKLVEKFLGRPFGFESYQRWLDEVN